MAIMLRLISTSGSVTTRGLMTIDGLVLLQGELPKRKLQAVCAWAQTRREALLAAWYLAVSNRNPGKIA